MRAAKDTATTSGAFKDGAVEETCFYPHALSSAPCMCRLGCEQNDGVHFGLRILAHTTRRHTEVPTMMRSGYLISETGSVIPQWPTSSAANEISQADLGQLSGICYFECHLYL